MAASRSWHVVKNLFLLCLSLAFLPVSTIIITLIHLRNRYHGQKHPSQAAQAHRKTVLITGVNMSKGLFLARLFHRQGHRVIGADANLLSLGRVSSCIDKFYVLPKPSQPAPISEDFYIQGLVAIVQQENVDLWISVSDVTAAMKDALAMDAVERCTRAKAVQLREEEIRLLDTKEEFVRHVESLGLRVPETKAVGDQDSLKEFLEERSGLYLQPDKPVFLVKPTGVDDVNRFDMPLLPLSTTQQTLAAIESLPLSSGTFIVQEFIHGPEYCTHALVIRGKVRAFTACPSSTVLMHYTSLPTESALSRAMLDFTKKVAEAGGGEFTGHMSFDFLVREGEVDDKEVKIYPIECNPRVHTAILLFNDTPELVEEYLSVLTPETDEDAGKIAIPLTPRKPLRYYWVGQDLVENVVLPLYNFSFGGQTSISQLRESLSLFATHVLYWKDGTFETWDPWPWWWLYHVYWPLKFFGYLFDGKWHMINVSTGKAFKAK